MIKTSQFIDGYKNGTVPAATIIKMAAFKDELEKTAVGKTFMDTLRNSFSHATTELLPQMIIGGGMIGLGTALHEGIKALENRYQEYKLDLEKVPAYEAMIKQHPELKEDETMAKVYFDALWHYSPIMAQEPLSAGAYIKNSLNMHHVAQGPLPSVVKELVDISKMHHDATEAREGEGTLGNIFIGLKSGPTAVVSAMKSMSPTTKMKPGITKTQFENRINPLFKNMVNTKQFEGGMGRLQRRMVTKKTLYNVLKNRNKPQQPHP